MYCFSRTSQHCVLTFKHVPDNYRHSLGLVLYSYQNFSNMFSLGHVSKSRFQFVSAMVETLLMNKFVSQFPVLHNSSKKATSFSLLQVLEQR